MKTKLKGNLYAKLIVIALIIATVFGISSAIKKVFAEVAEEVNEENNYTVTEEAGKIESWLNSEDYLVVDWDISRIAPNTKIDKFKSEFNKNTIIENGADTDEKSTNISTDSTVIVEDENKSYKVSVVGDLDKDGQSNQVELTSIIRATVNPEMWSLKGIFEKSADMELDGKINKQDVNASINYIVYGDLEIPEFAPVKAPLIEVISGTYNENIEAYEDDIEIRITTTQENALKTVYKVVGTVDTEYKEIISGDTVIIKSNGMYGIKAYTYGELGNRSDINYLIVSKKNASAAYTVEHYLEELDGTYTKDEQATETLSGRIGEQASATPKYYLGYSENTEHQDRVASGIVKEDGSLVLKLYYSRNSYEYTVKYFYDNEIDEQATEVKEAVFGSTVNNYNEKQKEGYILDVTKGDNGVIGLPLTISAVPSENIVEVYYVYNDYRVVIHHYKEGTGVSGAEGENSAPESIVADEELRSEIITTFTVTDLLNENNINTIGEIQISDRQYLDANKYTLSRVERNEEKTTIDENGTISGKVEKDVQEITFWYSVNTYEITGEVVGGNGVLTYVGDETVTEIKEIVEYDGKATKTIKAKPNYGYKVESLKLYSGESVDGTYGDENDGGEDLLTVRGVAKDKYLNVTIPKTLFRGIRENKHIVVTYTTAPIVAQIVAVPAGSEDMKSDIDEQKILYHEYYTLEAAIYDAKLANVNPGQVEIRILADINGEINIIEPGNNVIIDLNGYNISLEDDENVNIEVKQDGSLTVIDKSDLQDGAIINTEGTAVYIREGGELTLGNINMPVYITSPTIQGKTYGIYREEGTIFNFYDGQVIGETNTAIAGYAEEINTPELYEVVVAVESPKQTAFLSIPAGIEAMIGRTKYNTLEQAFQAVEEAQGYNINTPVEIDVVAEVTIEDAIKLSSNKNVILDLNGNNINATQENYIFENSGNMEIKDSSALVEEDYVYATLVNNGEYYFEVVDDHLEANNKGVANSTANSYIEVDLTDKAIDEEFELAVNVNRTSQKDYDYGYVTIIKQTEENDATIAPLPTTEDGRIVYTSGIVGIPDHYITTLTGGEKYYVHLGYNKDADTDWYLDTFVINNITLNGKPLIKELVQGKGSITSTTYSVIKNEESGNLVLSSGNIIIASNNQRKYCGVNNYGNFTMTGGYIFCLGNWSNFVYKDGVINNATAEGKKVLLNGGMFAVGNTNNKNATMIVNLPTRIYSYNDANIYNNGTLTINNGTFSSNTSCLESRGENATIEIKDGQFIAYTTAIDNSNGNINIKDAKIKTYGLALDTYKGLINIDYADIETYDNGAILSSSGTININDISIVSEGYGISSDVNYKDNNITIKDGNIIAKRYAIGTSVKIYDGTYISKESDCIYAHEHYGNVPTINIYGGIYETKSQNHYVINNAGTGTINIGIKNTDENKEVSTTNPKLQGVTNGIYNSKGTINFYDGQIIALPGNTIKGKITEIEEKNSEGNDLDLNISSITENEIVYDKLTLQPVIEPVAKTLKTSIDLNLTSLIENTDYTSDDQYYYFYNLKDAVSACSTTAGTNITEIEIIDNILTAKNLEILEGQNINIDLNGLKIDVFSASEFIKNNGTLKITDSAGEANGSINVGGTAIVNEGVLETSANIINTGIYEGTRDSNDIPQKNTIVNNGTYILNDGIVQADNIGTAIVNSGIFTLNNGTINALGRSDYKKGSYGILNKANAKCIINNGKIYCDIGYNYSCAMGIKNIDTATIKINGGTIDTGRYCAIYDENTSEYEEGISNPVIYITGGIINSSIKSNNTTNDILFVEEENSEIIVNSTIDVYNGKLKIDGGTYNSSIINYYGTKTEIINANVNANITLGYSTASADSIDVLKNTTVIGKATKTNGGTLEITNSSISNSYNSSALQSDDNAIITITNSNITSAGGYAVENKSTGTINILEGNTTIQSNGTTGLYNQGAGFIIIGEQNGVVSEEYPKIIGKSYGLYNSNASAEIKFYDGVITGETDKSIYGTINDVEVGYDIIKLLDTENSKESSVLRKVTVAKILKSSINANNLNNIEEYVEETDENGVEYYAFYKLQDAATVCTDNQNTTIIVTRDITYTVNSETENIPANKDIKLDLAGYNISASNENTIINNGTLEIIDSSSSVIITSKDNFITNNGTLKIGDVYIKSTANGTEDKYANIIANNGVLALEGSKLEVTSSYINMVNNTATFDSKNSKYIAPKGNNLTRKALYNSGTAKMEEDIENDDFSIQWSHIYNDGSGTLELVNMNIFGGIVNTSDKKYEEGVSKPAIRISGGNIHDGYEEYRIVWTFNIINSNGEIIFEDYIDNTDVNNPITNKLKIWSEGGNTYTCVGTIKNVKDTNSKLTFNSGDFEQHITNEETGIINLNGGNIYKNGGYSSCTITNNESAVFNYNGGQLGKEGNSQELSGIVNNGTFNISSKTDLVIYASGNITNTGTFNIGENDSTLNENYPFISLSAGSGSVISTGTLNYNDGIIKTAKDVIPVQQIISAIPEDSQIIYTVTDEYNSYKLSKNTVVATIGDNNEYYTLESAFEAAKTIENAVIKMQESVAVAEGTAYTIDSTQNTTLDLNGKRIRGNCTSTLFTNEGTYELTDSTDTQDTINGSISAYALGLVENSGTLKISGGAYDLRHEMEGKVIVNNTGTATVEMTGGKITAKYGKGTTYNGPGYGIKSTSTGNITISGGQIECSGADYGGRANGIFIENTDENSKPILTINGPVTIVNTGNTYALTLNNAKLIMSDGIIGTEYNELINSTAVVSGGTLGNSVTLDVNSTFALQDKGKVVAVTNRGVATVTGGTITGQFENSNSATFNDATVTGAGCISNSKGTMTIENTNINTTNTGLRVSAGIVDVNKDVTIISTGSYAIYVSGGTLNILDNLIANTSSSSYSSSCVYIYKGTINVTGEAEFTSDNAEGIEINSGIVNLGNKAYPVTKDYPKVTGGTYGVYRSGGTFNFYDGILKGTTKALYGVVADMPELYSVVFADETETTAYLGIIATFEGAAKFGDTTYETLSAAINAVKTSDSKEGTIFVSKDLVLSEPVEIFEGLNVVLDLQGHSIRYSSTENATIINNGVLSIIDTETTEDAKSFGYIENVTGVAIQNNGTLTLGTDDETVLTNAPKIIGGTYAIENATDTILNFYDGTLEGITAAINGADITNITSQEGYSVKDGSVVVDGDETDEKITYLTKYLGK